MPTSTFDKYAVAPWERFDALDFERIARMGYVPGQQEQHYFPLLPALERLLSSITGGSLGFAGLVVSTMAFFAALVMLRRLVAADIDGPTADLACSSSRSRPRQRSFSPPTASLCSSLSA